MYSLTHLAFLYFKCRVIPKSVSLVTEVINSVYRIESEANYREKVGIKIHKQTLLKAVDHLQLMLLGVPNS